MYKSWFFDFKFNIKWVEQVERFKDPCAGDFSYFSACMGSNWKLYRYVNLCKIHLMFQSMYTPHMICHFL